MNRKLSYLLIAFGLVLALVIPAAAQLGIGTNNPDPSAALDIVSTTQGVLHPRLTTAQRNAISSPAEGLTIYNTTDKCIQFWDGTAWKCAVGGSGDGSGNTSTNTSTNALGGIDTTVPTVFASTTLRQIWGFWSAATVPPKRMDINPFFPSSYFWLDNNTFGRLDLGATDGGQPLVPFIQLYDTNFSLRQRLVITDFISTSQESYTNRKAIALDSGNILVFVDAVSSSSVRTVQFLVIDRTGQIVIPKTTLVGGPTGLDQLAAIPLTNNGFVLSVKDQAGTTDGVFSLYFFDATGTKVGQYTPSVNTSGQLNTRFIHDVVPTSFGVAMVFPPAITSGPDSYVALSMNGTVLIAPTPIFTGTGTVFEVTQNNTWLPWAMLSYLVKGANNQLFIMRSAQRADDSRPDVYKSGLMKLTYDPVTGAITPSAPITVSDVYAPYFNLSRKFGGQAGLSPAGTTAVVAKGDSIYFPSLQYQPAGSSTATPVGVTSDGSPVFSQTFYNKLYGYNFASNTYTTAINLAPGAGYFANWLFTGFTQGSTARDRDLRFSPDGNHLLVTSNNSTAAQMLFDTTDMSNIKPVSFKIRADNTPQDFGRRFRVFDMSDAIKKAVITVSGGANNELSCDFDYTPIPVCVGAGNTLTMQSSSSQPSTVFSDALDRVRIATDTPGERTVTIKVTNAANVVSQSFTFTVVVE